MENLYKKYLGLTGLVVELIRFLVLASSVILDSLLDHVYRSAEEVCVTHIACSFY